MKSTDIIYSSHDDDVMQYQRRGEEGRVDEDVAVGFWKDGEAYLFGKEAKSDQMLMKLEKDDMLGKLPFYYIGQEPHCATVMASEDLETQKINTDNIMKEYARLPRVLRNMINNVSTCVAKTTSDFLHQNGVSDEAETENRPDSASGLEAYDENQSTSTGDGISD